MTHKNYDYSYGDGVVTVTHYPQPVRKIVNITPQEFESQWAKIRNYPDAQKFLHNLFTNPKE